MKKIFSLILIMLLAIGGAYALSYSAFITLSSGASFTKVSDEDMLRTSYQLTLEAEPAGIRFGNSSISINVRNLSIYSGFMYGKALPPFYLRERIILQA